MVIGYYVHHHGVGHLTRARVITSTLRARGIEVVLLGSDLGGTPGITLPRDDDGDQPFEDPQSSKALHWAPLGHAGFSARMRGIASWVIAHRPSVVVVDVSVEVVSCLRLLGVRTVIVAQPGDRRDDAHTLAFRCATAILAPWPAEARPCPALSPFASKVFHSGGISGVLERQQPPDVAVLLIGRGGAADPGMVQQLREQLPGMPWVEAGWPHWVRDVGALLARAHVVVTHCGQNAIADVAALDVPAVLCPQPRPHGEQFHLSDELSRLDLALTAPRKDGTHLDWVSLVDQAIKRPSQWARWRTESASTRAADLIEGVARG